MAKTDNQAISGFFLAGTAFQPTSDCYSVRELDWLEDEISVIDHPCLMPWHEGAAFAAKENRGLCWQRKGSVASSKNERAPLTA